MDKIVAIFFNESIGKIMIMFNAILNLGFVSDNN
jgi:hypothetical protein